jgi:hypothetical protein
MPVLKREGRKEVGIVPPPTNFLDLILLKCRPMSFKVGDDLSTIFEMAGFASWTCSFFFH